MKLEEIGFYTLSDKRAQTSTHETPLQRCELILTDACNFRCPYCRGLDERLKGTMPLEQAKATVQFWLDHGLKNIRFSGGEPMLYNGLVELVEMCKAGGVEHIAISTNGSVAIAVYKKIIEAGVNDFSISLDGGCCAVGDKMAGLPNSGVWNKVVDNIRAISKLTYVTVGMVFTEENVNDCVEAVLFADSLGVSDIRVIPSAQFNRALQKLVYLPSTILAKYPILRYRIGNLQAGKPIRGIEKQRNKCRLVLDDMAIAGGFHFPCIIYLREQGSAIGKVGADMRKERLDWMEQHTPHLDPICNKMCLDVCIQFNETAAR